EAAARLQNLIDDLVGGEATLEAKRRCRAEGAPHAAPHLRRDAECQAVGDLRRDEHALDPGTVGELEEKLLRTVGGARQTNDAGPRDRERALQQTTQLLREVAHRGERVDSLSVEPLEDLLRPIGRLSPRGEPAGELVERELFDVAIHRSTPDA